MLRVQVVRPLFRHYCGCHCCYTRPVLCCFTSGAKAPVFSVLSVTAKTVTYRSSLTRRDPSSLPCRVFPKISNQPLLPPYLPVFSGAAVCATELPGAPEAGVEDYTFQGIISEEQLAAM